MAMMRMFGTKVDIKLPDLGEGTKEATVKEILVEVGQHVEEVRYFTKLPLIAKTPLACSMKILSKYLLTS